MTPLNECCAWAMATPRRSARECGRRPWSMRIMRWNSSRSINPERSSSNRVNMKRAISLGPNRQKVATADTNCSKLSTPSTLPGSRNRKMCRWNGVISSPRAPKNSSTVIRSLRSTSKERNTSRNESSSRRVRPASSTMRFMAASLSPGSPVCWARATASRRSAFAMRLATCSSGARLGPTKRRSLAISRLSVYTSGTERRIQTRAPPAMPYSVRSSEMGSKHCSERASSSVLLNVSAMSVTQVLLSPRLNQSTRYGMCTTPPD
mmetsp:Transcript_2018/g.6026  ORF Transcript_2018/g.6026 Transcript_2018/m.6026 type:complete len:264 (-) Transcript_2018:273-1064(-)